MKRFLSLLLAALMLISCATALAETERYKELGFAIDFSAVRNQSANYPFVKNDGVVKMEPFLSVMDIAEIHKRMQEKGCGIIGVEEERDTTENTADTARKVLADNGVTYPNVWMPKDNPVKGVIVQLCDESTCSFQKTKADGIATFQVDAPKVYDVHVGKVPDGYVISDETYKTLDTFSDVNIFITKAE